MNKPFVVIATFGLLVGVLSSGCAVEDAGDDAEPEASEDQSEALTASQIVARATSWADAQLKYCGGPNGGRDVLCGGTCSRQKNAAWDKYRSDCSGLVSYAWGLPAPGATTLSLPGKSRGQKAIASLAPGDAINGKDHVMLFASWHNAANHEANLIEENKCGGHARKVTYKLNVGSGGCKGARISGYSDCFIGLAHP